MTIRSVAAVAALAFAAPVAAQFGYDMVSYHGVTHASHQTSFNNLEPQGYRLISLTVAGGWAAAHYSAVWLRASGAPWVSAHGMSESQYTSQRTSWLLQGYRAKIVSASGNGTDKVYAAVYVDDGVVNSAQINLSLAAFEADAATKRNTGYRLVSCAAYGSLTLPLFAPVYEADATGIAWGWEAHEGLATFNNTFLEYGQGEARPTWFATTDGLLYLSVWRDDRVGGWAAVVDRTAAQFTADKANMASQGLVPLCIAAGNSGASARFAGIFVERLTPYARTLTRTGTANAAMQPFDDYMTQFVQDNNVRAASIAVTKDGRLVYARGYTFAEPGYAITQPTSLFRLGSISKPISAMLAHDLVESGVGGLSLNSNLVNTLGITNYASGIQNINLQRLLTHTSGMVNVVSELAAAQAANPGNPTMPPDESVITAYACTQAPTTINQYRYSNAGLTAVGQLIEQATGQQWLSALSGRLATPLQITRLYRMQALRSQLHPGEVHYHLGSLYLRAGNLDVAQRLMAPQYCQRFWDSAGGAVTSAVDLARLIAGSFQIGGDSPVFGVARQNAMLNRQSYPVNGSPTTTEDITDGGWFWEQDASNRYVYAHDGAQDGFRSYALFRDDGVGIFVCGNADAQVSSSALRAKADLVTSWPTNDLFPTYGLPSFPRTPSFSGFFTGSLANVTKGAFSFLGDNLDQVTSVQFGGQLLPVALSTAWENGYVELVSATQLRVHPPQGLNPGAYSVRAYSAQGGGNTVNVTITLAPAFVVQVQDWVLGGAMPFSLIAGRGQLSSLSWVALALSQSNAPSVAPGIVSLGLGAMFSDFFATDLQAFSPIARTVRWDFPGLAGYGDTHFQCAAIDFGAPAQFPLVTTPMVTLIRQ